LENYYLLKKKKYLTDVKQHVKGLNFFTNVTQLPLLWQHAIAMAGILALK
jgi:hypothetical protein